MPSSIDDRPSVDGCAPSSFPEASYEPSITSSSASSTQVSVFSDDASIQGSIASSISDDFRTGQEDGQNRYCLPSHVSQHQSQHSQPPTSISDFCRPQHPTYADITSLPSEQRQHPRRCSLARSQKPPPLLRQAERKLNFVDNLVDSASQMVEVIWPLSMVPSRSESCTGRGVLPLRTYIEETLRRSRTSYSTLQVALYYLILIKPHVPHRDFTMEQRLDCEPARRALMCGRRMFLAALILASKYLQDRNYSAKAWSKMSGLRVCEINSNERVFLERINWKLHVAKPIFDRWTDIVLKYTPSSHPPSPPPGDGIVVGMCWRTLVPILTPELDNVPLVERSCRTSPNAAPSPFDFAPSASPTPTKEDYGRMQIDSGSQDTTPTPANACPPRFLEPKPTLLPPTPALARMGPLPTPQLTPSTVASNTPAVSVCGGSRRPSMCSAMSMAQRGALNRCVNEDFPFPNMDKLRSLSRRPSIASSTSTRSSPESLISDLSRSSRASSISSVATVSTTSSCLAPQRTNLARLATTRNVRLPLQTTDRMDEGKEIGGSAAMPITIVEEEDGSGLSSPDFSLNEKKLHAPHRHSKHAPHHHIHQAQHHPHPALTACGSEKSRKRHRTSRGSRRSDFYDEVRFQLEDEEQDAMVVDLVDSDEDMSSPSPAALHAANLLRRSECIAEAKEAQMPASLSRRNAARVPLQRQDGTKRTCCSSRRSQVGFKGSSLYTEVA